MTDTFSISRTQRELAWFNRSHYGNRIQIYNEYGLFVGNRAITHILRKDYQIPSPDLVTVEAYFTLLEQRRRNPTISAKKLAHHIKQETGFKGSLQIMYGWIYNRIVPRDVKLALSEGYPIKPSLIVGFPQLQQYIPTNLSLT